MWCGALSPNGERLALGCEDGSIRLFDVTSNTPSYSFAMFGHVGRALSVAWAYDSIGLVSGGSDSTIRHWSITSQRNTARMTVETLGKEKTLIWCVKVLRDRTVISGDSLGHVQFWDARFGTLLHSFTQVLCLCPPPFPPPPPPPHLPPYPTHQPKMMIKPISVFNHNLYVETIVCN